MVDVRVKDAASVHEELHHVLGAREDRIEEGLLHGEHWFVVLVRDAGMIVKRRNNFRERTEAG
jgi:hypothetical protein